MASATAITPSTVLIVDKDAMQKVLHEQHELSDLFIQFVLTRNIRIEEDLIDQLFNSTEKRLARTLLLLARYGKPDPQQRILPKVSQETRAETNLYKRKSVALLAIAVTAAGSSVGSEMTENMLPSWESSASQICCSTSAMGARPEMD